MVDRNIDKQVVRTRMRPLAIAESSLTEAFFILVILLFGALLVALQLTPSCFYFALAALLITLLYPFCKRFLKAPQMILGIAFSMGIPMAYVASGVSLNSDCIMLFLINFSWIITYDTMYAMTDKEDDLKIGVKSTAIYFADYDRLIIGIFQLFLNGLWLRWAWVNNSKEWFYLFWTGGAMVFFYQQKLINHRIPLNCFKAFRVSAYYGFIMWMAVAAALIDELRFFYKH